MSKNLEAMSNPELVELYNSLSDTPVARFSTRGAGIKRIQKLLEVTTETGESALIDEPKLFHTNEHSSLFDQPGECGCGEAHEGTIIEGTTEVQVNPNVRVNLGIAPPVVAAKPAAAPKVKKAPVAKKDRVNKLMDLDADKTRPSVRPRPGSKREQLIALMLAAGGVTRMEMMTKFVWSESDCRDAVYRVNKIDNFSVKEIEAGVYTAVESAFLPQ
jgi:hypothetical protein